MTPKMAPVMVAILTSLAFSVTLAVEAPLFGSFVDVDVESGTVAE